MLDISVLIVLNVAQNSNVAEVLDPTIFPGKATTDWFVGKFTWSLDTVAPSKRFAAQELPPTESEPSAANEYRCSRPFGIDEQPELPATAVYDPGGQELHTESEVAFAVVEKVPKGHKLQREELQ